MQKNNFEPKWTCHCWIIFFHFCDATRYSTILEWDYSFAFFHLSMNSALHFPILGTSYVYISQTLITEFLYFGPLFSSSLFDLFLFPQLQFRKDFFHLRDANCNCQLFVQVKLIRIITGKELFFFLTQIILSTIFYFPNLIKIYPLIQLAKIMPIVNSTILPFWKWPDRKLFPRVNYSVAYK